MNAEEKALERKAKEGMNPDEEASFAGKIQVYIFPPNFTHQNFPYKLSPTYFPGIFIPQQVFPANFLLTSFPPTIYTFVIILQGIFEKLEHP